MWKTHPNPCSGTGLNYYLLNTRETLPNRRHTSRQAVSGPILYLEEMYRAGGTSSHVPRGVLPASEEQPERKGHLKRFTRGRTLLAWTKRLCVVPSVSRSVAGDYQRRPSGAVSLDQLWVCLLSILTWNVSKNLESSVQEMKGLEIKTDRHHLGAGGDGERDAL